MSLAGGQDADGQPIHNPQDASTDFKTRLRSFKYAAEATPPPSPKRTSSDVAHALSPRPAKSRRRRRGNYTDSTDNYEDSFRRGEDVFRYKHEQGSLHHHDVPPKSDRRSPLKPSKSTIRADRREPLGPAPPRSSATKSSLDRRKPLANPPPFTPSPSNTKRSAGYAPPSTYSHLPHLTDVVAPSLLVLFVGLNPGVTTAKTGHAYAHPSNLFWKLLASSGVTPERYPPEHDVKMPELCSCGFTNIVSRPTATQSELSRAEMVAGTPVLEGKVGVWRPEVVVLVGKGIWEAVFEYRYGRKQKKAEFRYGWQDEVHNLGRGWKGEVKKEDRGKTNREHAAESKPENEDEVKEQDWVVVEKEDEDESKLKDEEGEEEWDGARLFVAASTSGASASLKPAEKEEIWRPLGDWVKRRRREREVAKQNRADAG